MKLETLFFLLLGLAIAAFWLGHRTRGATRLPKGRLIYTDTTRWQPTRRPLFSRRHRLTGRPDYLLERRRDVTPIEVKSGSAPPDGPYESHILQLAAYCLLVAETYDRRPSHGILLYADDDQAFQVDYTPALEHRLLTVLDEMRQALHAGWAPRDHEQFARCQACGFLNACDQSLA